MNGLHLTVAYMNIYRKHYAAYNCIPMHASIEHSDKMHVLRWLPYRSLHY